MQQKKRWNYHLIWKIPLGTLEVFFGVLSLYICIALFGMLIQVGDDYVPKKEGVKIYLRTDGIHTDFIVPVHSAQKDWTKTLSWNNLKGTDTTFQYVAFGWGDQGFFLHTPEWSDLKFSVAFDALFYRGTTAVHVVYQAEPEEGKLCERLIISEEQYQHLITYIENTFKTDPKNIPVSIAKSGYWDYDVFYEAHGKYSLFNTCNSWINGGLKAAELPACLWTPLSFGILEKYD